MCLSQNFYHAIIRCISFITRFARVVGNSGPNETFTLSPNESGVPNGSHDHFLISPGKKPNYPRFFSGMSNCGFRNADN
jgi:hypothetical protein